MKIIKAKIKKNRTVGATEFTYPDLWDSENINVLAYEDSDNMGQVEEYCIGLIHGDEYADKLIAASSDVEEIDEKEADELGKKWKPKKHVIDMEALPNILIAVAKEPKLRTVEENAILNPEDNTPGIRVTQEFNVRRWYPE